MDYLECHDTVCCPNDLICLHEEEQETCGTPMFYQTLICRKCLKAYEMVKGYRVDSVKEIPYSDAFYMKNTNT